MANLATIRAQLEQLLARWRKQDPQAEDLGRAERASYSLGQLVVEGQMVTPDQVRGVVQQLRAVSWPEAHKDEAARLLGQLEQALQ